MAQQDKKNEKAEIILKKIKLCKIDREEQEDKDVEA